MVRRHEVAVPASAARIRVLRVRLSQQMRRKQRYIADLAVGVFSQVPSQ